MEEKYQRLIFHVDVNSAFLSWEAVYRLQRGYDTDLREIPSVVGGDEAARHGIVLAKSTPAKKFNISTAETLFSARQKCPELVCVPPRYDLYVKCSEALYNILLQYTPKVQRFSIDESFLDFTGMEYLYPNAIELAYSIKDRIKQELGFTVNVGVSTNKILAKMASDFKKPDMVHSLFPREIKEKFWPLPVETLFMVGRATLPKLNKLNIFTVGDLANYKLEALEPILKSQATVIWRYANGIDFSEVSEGSRIDMKGIGNSTTIPFDTDDRDTAHKVLLSLCETVALRLRNSRNCCRLISVSIKDNKLIGKSMQHKYFCATDSTRRIAISAWQLFDKLWDGSPIRHLGVGVSALCSNDFFQTSFMEEMDSEKIRCLDKTIDDIRRRYGSDSLVRAVFLNSGLSPLTGGVGEDEYPAMTSIL